ncbi:hypothetical protein JDV02_005059 [Purpureocillium takamizusanense]|uniref:Uncharacterized protein n=1 Tax=Purpureocillium takamizusanense TaxID=2060973 RepID=A0A9Q8VBH3_9HYPO|nr:uncharacterized protein JDV02_005059 [Purpureocillium takamizusanense]UNI18812.1 hypothetical protein JDV02_005059 [Purpureocillium takamizusanense]
MAPLNTLRWSPRIDDSHLGQFLTLDARGLRTHSDEIIQLRPGQNRTAAWSRSRVPLGYGMHIVRFTQFEQGCSVETYISAHDTHESYRKNGCHIHTRLWYRPEHWPRVNGVPQVMVTIQDRNQFMIFQWKEGEEPRDLNSDSPNPSSWGQPLVWITAERDHRGTRTQACSLDDVGFYPTRLTTKIRFCAVSACPGYENCAKRKGHEQCMALATRVENGDYVDRPYIAVRQVRTFSCLSGDCSSGIPTTTWRPPARPVRPKVTEKSATTPASPKESKKPRTRRPKGRKKKPGSKSKGPKDPAKQRPTPPPLAPGQPASGPDPAGVPGGPQPVVPDRERGRPTQPKVEGRAHVFDGCGYHNDDHHWNDFDPDPGVNFHQGDGFHSGDKYCEDHHNGCDHDHDFDHGINFHRGGDFHSGDNYGSDFHNGYGFDHNYNFDLGINFHPSVNFHRGDDFHADVKYDHHNDYDFGPDDFNNPGIGFDRGDDFHPDENFDRDNNFNEGENYNYHTGYDSDPGGNFDDLDPADYLDQDDVFGGNIFNEEDVFDQGDTYSQGDVPNEGDAFKEGDVPKEGNAASEGDAFQEGDGSKEGNAPSEEEDVPDQDGAPGGLPDQDEVLD